MAMTIDWEGQPWGVRSDAEIAKTLGTCRHTVGKHRRGMGIPAFDQALPIDWDSLPLGEVADSVIAKMLGVGRSTVQRQRDRRLIPPWGLDPLG
jgi:hypothetical protein